MKKIILTNLPSFYSVNLYNRIADHLDLTVVFTGSDYDSRNEDFLNLNMKFKHIELKGNEIQKMFQFRKVLKSIPYDELIIGGIASISAWMGIIVSPKSKTSTIIESSINESTTKGIKGILKRIFNGHMKRAYCSGKSQADLAYATGFNGEMVITKGVGVFNYHQQPPYLERKTVRNFVYVGRLVWQKNLHFLIKQFNRHPELHLDIIGFGVQESELKSIAGDNINFLGAVNNKELAAYYNKADVFILASKSEAWGLVVEEALNNGTPVMVSNKVGCADEIVNDSNGVVFELTEEDFEQKLGIITNVEKYNSMRKYISEMDFDKIEEEQVKCYLK